MATYPTNAAPNAITEDGRGHSAAAYRAVLARAAQHAVAHLDRIDSTSVAATASKEQLRARLTRALDDAGVDATQVIDDLVHDVQGGLLGSAGGRFFTWVIGGTLPAALAADWLTGAWDQNGGMYATSPAASIVEEVCGAWLKDVLRLPPTASFALVTGCQMAHVTCLAAARHQLLRQRGWDVERDGLSGAPRVRMLAGDHLHGSIERAVRLLGFGSASVTVLPTDENCQLSYQTLADALATEPNTPTIVLLQAGDINTGVFDPFETLIPLAHEHRAWVHVDGAFGLWANASATLQHMLRGVERADSWSSDGHKWLNVPFDCGYAFVAHPDAHRASMSHRASYLTHDTDARDQLDWNPEWSRRARGLATYAALRELGRSGIADVVERCCRYAHALATRIGALQGAEMVWEPQLNQALVRFLDASTNATEADHAKRTDDVIAAIQRGGEAHFGGTTWHGMRCMRISVCSWQTTDADVERTVAAVRQVLSSY
jgi:glutamate/tyrosine decarboxylase-like PLP-dependent enzyme